MIDSGSLSIGKRISRIQERGRLGLVLEMIVVFSPFAILGGIGEYLGDGTAAGALVINLAYLIGLGLATVGLKVRGSGWRDIGLARPKSWPKTVLLAVGTLAAYLLITIGLQAILASLIGQNVPQSDRSSFDVLYGNLPLLVLYVIAAWTSIAFGEEMIFRAYLMSTLSQLFAPAKARWTLALLISSVFFGIAHFSWGLVGVVEMTILGLVLGFVYLRSGRNLWITIIAHGIANTLGFVLVYLGSG